MSSLFANSLAPSVKHVLKACTMEEDSEDINDSKSLMQASENNIVALAVCV